MKGGFAWSGCAKNGRRNKVRDARSRRRARSRQLLREQACVCVRERDDEEEEVWAAQLIVGNCREGAKTRRQAR